MNKHDNNHVSDDNLSKVKNKKIHMYLKQQIPHVFQHTVFE
jgi:hypothetical protein